MIVFVCVRYVTLTYYTVVSVGGDYSVVPNIGTLTLCNKMTLKMRLAAIFRHISFVIWNSNYNTIPNRNS